MSSHTRGLVVGFAAVLLFGFTVVLQAFLVDEGIASFAAVGIRYLWSGVVCLGIVVALRRPVLPVRGERIAAILLGAIAYGLQAVLFYAALGHGTVASVSLLFYTYPILVLLGSLLLGLRSWSWLAGGSAAMSAMGAALVVATGRQVTIDGAGILMALGSSCCVAVFLLANSRLIPRTPALVAATWVSFGVAASTLSLALALGEFHALSGRAWLILAVSGTTTGLGTAAMYVALAELGPAPTSVLLSLQTIVAIVGSALLLGQPVLVGQIIGGAAIIGAIALSAYGNRPSRARQREAEPQTSDVSDPVSPPQP
jgi:drug/metabolite transporter (DMT)-like permease